MVCFVPVQPVAASLPALPAFGTRSGRPGREHVLAVEYAVGRNEGIFVTRVRPDQMGLVLLVDHRGAAVVAVEVRETVFMLLLAAVVDRLSARLTLALSTCDRARYTPTADRACGVRQEEFGRRKTEPKERQRSSQGHARERSGVPKYLQGARRLVSRLDELRTAYWI